DREARRARQHQIPPEDRPVRPPAIAMGPEPEEDREVRHRLVDRGGMYVHPRGLVPADDGVGVAHPPGQRGLRAPIAVARELTTPATDRLTEHDRRRHRVRTGEEREAVATED